MPAMSTCRDWITSVIPILCNLGQEHRAQTSDALQVATQAPVDEAVQKFELPGVCLAPNVSLLLKAPAPRLKTPSPSRRFGRF
jgi:hypothetical protein